MSPEIVGGVLVALALVVGVWSEINFRRARKLSEEIADAYDTGDTIARIRGEDRSTHIMLELERRKLLDD